MSKSRSGPEYNAYMASYMAARRARRKTIILGLLGQTCCGCGGEDQLDVDRVDPKCRTFRLSGRGLDRPWVEILLELAKCQLLCKDCHRRKNRLEGSTAGGWNRITDVRHGTSVMYSQKCRCTVCRDWKRKYRSGSVSASGKPRVM